MKKFDQAEFKRVVSAKKGRTSPWQTAPASGSLVSKAQRSAGKMFGSVLSKAGFDIDKLNKIVAQNQNELRTRFQKQQAAAIKNFSRSETAYRQRIEARQKALGLLTQPFVSTFITLDKPFLIWQLPHPELDIFIDSRIESMNSSIRILINTNSGSDNTQFVFYYLWENESEYAAVINAASSLVLNGFCEVAAAPGIFSGDSADLSMNAWLTTMRWSGWGTDLVTGASNDQTVYPDYQPTQRQIIATLHAHGGHIFGGQGVDTQAFSFEPFDLSENFIFVPGRAVTVFEVTFQLSYSFDDGGNISDLVAANFADNGNAIFCPLVQLELLTAPPNMAVA
jgi:hypothetical protein